VVRRRLLLVNVLLVALTLGAFGLGAYLVAADNLQRAVDRELTRKAEAVERAWKNVAPRLLALPSGTPGLFPNQPAALRRALFTQAFVLPRFYRQGDVPLFGNEPPWDEESLHAAWGGKRVFSTALTPDDELRLLSIPLRDSGRVVATVQFGATLTDARVEQARLREAFAMFIPVALIVATAAGWLLTRLALRPVGALADAASRIEASNLGERLPVNGRDEFAHLSATVNALLDRIAAAFGRLEEAYDGQRRLTADMAHELKTPLAAVQMEADVALLAPRSEEEYRRALEAIVRTSHRMGSLVADMMLLAQSDEGRLDLRREPTLLNELLEEIAEDVAALPGPPIHVEVPSRLTLDVDPRYLARILRNLLENARRHSPHDRPVTLTAAVRGHGIEIQVIDQGEGIAAEHLPRLFDRFYRIEMSRARGQGGTGLGLAICRSLVEAHGGTIHVDSTVGAGTRVTLFLPAP
jgi:signal transduction histidine kinase